MPLEQTLIQTGYVCARCHEVYDLPTGPRGNRTAQRETSCGGHASPVLGDAVRTWTSGEGEEYGELLLLIQNARRLING